MTYKCTNPWSTCFIWKNGDVTHCCYSNAGPIGNIYKDSLEEIFSSQKIQNIRENISKGQYQKAGCEYFCRPYRWSKLYNQNKNIPEGLGRINDIDEEALLPKIIGVEFDGHCNMNCEHCLGSHDHTKGLADEMVESLIPYLKQAEIVRVVGGEFSVNPRNIAFIKKVSTWEKQPTLFLNTNGKRSLLDYKESINKLQSLHMKFSLEGLGEDYEKIRKGGIWTEFEENLDQACVLFQEKVEAGKDWKLYLNFCVMKSNFESLPQVVAFAIDKSLPLVVNTVNGMRHVDENMFVYEYLKPSEQTIQKVMDEIEFKLLGSDYEHEALFREHFDYVLKAMNLPKLKVKESNIRRLTNRYTGPQAIKADRLLYIRYRFQQSFTGGLGYLWRKVKKRLIDFSR